MIILYIIAGFWFVRGLLSLWFSRDRYKELEPARRFSRLTVEVPPGQKPWTTTSNKHT